MTETGRTGPRVVVAARIPKDVKSSLKLLARRAGKDLSPYIADVLTKHVPREVREWNATRGGRP